MPAAACAGEQARQARARPPRYPQVAEAATGSSAGGSVPAIPGLPRSQPPHAGEQQPVQQQHPRHNAWVQPMGLQFKDMAIRMPGSTASD